VAFAYAAGTIELRFIVSSNGVAAFCIRDDFVFCITSYSLVKRLIVSRSFILTCTFFSLTLLALTAGTSNAQPVPQSVPITIASGDQLGKLAQRYLVPSASSSNWREIAAVNKLAPPYTLRPGQKLLLPLQLLSTESVSAKITAIAGDVQLKKEGQAPIQLAIGSLIAEGEIVTVGANGSAMLLLADGSQVQLLAGSQLVLVEHRYYTSLKGGSASQAFAGLLRLLQGSVEARAAKVNDRATPLRIQTPTSVVGVRGTEFRVGTVGADNNITRTEVVEGAVMAQLDPKRSAGVSAGFGVRLDPASTEIPVPAKLLAAPDLSAWSKRHEKIFLEFPPLPTVQTSTTGESKPVANYRVQVAPTSERAKTESASDGFSAIIVDKVFKSGDAVRVAGLPDGHYLLRVRGIDSQGLEGFATTTSLMLRARPEPPLIQTPDTMKVVQNQVARLKWAGAKDTDTYAVEVINQQNGVVTVYETPNVSLELFHLAQGSYRWRVATQSLVTQSRVDTFSQLQLGARERGQWSEAATIVVIALPESPSAQAGTDDKQTLVLRWPDQKAARYEVQLARANDFESGRTEVTTTVVTTPSITFKNLDAGLYFVRYRAIEQDGFVNGWSPASQLNVPLDWKKILMFLGGVLMLWL
jgi:hypothetical protein